MSKKNLFRNAALTASVLIAGASSGFAQNPKETPVPDVDGKIRNVKPEVMGKVYKDWINKDVKYIITKDELRAFKELKTDEERENFIENFWRRRDPNPDTEENEFREEYY